MPLSAGCGFRFELVSLPCVWHAADRHFPGVHHVNADTHVIHILQGQGRMQIGDEAFDIVPARAFWIPPGVRYGCGKQPGVPLEMVNLHFHLAWGELSSGQVRMPVTFDLPQSQLEQLGQVATLWKTQRPLAQAQAFARIHQIVISHVQAHARPQPTVRPIDPRMQMLRRALEQQADTPYDASRFARRIHLSVSQMNRCFRQAFGTSPRVYHQQRRLALVQALLVQDDRPIKLLAEHLGFCDAFYFCRWFTRLTGQAPSDFRRQGWRI